VFGNTIPAEICKAISLILVAIFCLEKRILPILFPHSILYGEISSHNLDILNLPGVTLATSFSKELDSDSLKNVSFLHFYNTKQYPILWSIRL